MEILQLQYFERVAAYENFSRASRELGVTQSALSNSMNRLETELGVPLFRRVGKKVLLNNAGHEFLKTTQKILYLLSNNHLITHTPAGTGDELSIMIGSPDLEFLECLEKFRELHPSVFYRLYLDSQRLDSLLPTQDFLFSSPRHPFFHDMHHLTKISERSLYAVLPKCHPLANSELLFLSQLVNESFVFYRRSNGELESAYSLCKDAGFTPQIVYEVDQPILKLYFFIHAQAVGFVDNDFRDMLKPYADMISVIPIHQIRSQSMYLSWNEDMPLSSTATDFLEFVKGYFHV